MENLSQANKIRVLRIINRFNLGGITYNVSYLSRFLPDQYETMLIGGPEEEGEASSLYIPHSLGLEPTLISEMRRSVNPLSDFFAYRKIRKLIREFKPHIVHTHASKAGAIGRLAAIHGGVPVIVHTFHGHVFKGYFNGAVTRFFISIERWLAKRSTAIVAISEGQKKELSETYNICIDRKIHVVPLGFDLRRFTVDMESKRKKFREQFSLNDQTLAIGIIGRLAPIKDHSLFIEAMVHVSKACKRPVKGFIIGDGDIRSSLEKQVADKNATEHVVFTGWIKEVDIALAGLDIVALTSLNEGTPVSLIEAQVAGRFIVSTNVGGIRDILHPAGGFLSESGDKASYLQNLQRAVDEFDSIRHRAAEASEATLARFSYQRLCSDMDQLYTSLLP